MTAADTDVEAVQNMFAVNVFGPMRLVHSSHKMIIAAQSIIVNIGSIEGVCPYMVG
jgi:1-acylglycerone phosphate reductase